MDLKKYIRVEDLCKLTNIVVPSLLPSDSEIEDEKSEAGSVVQEIQPGYMLGERLLRPVLVGVAKKKNVKNEEKEEKRGHLLRVPLLVGVYGT